MKKTLVLTVVCPDRPGIVEQFTELIFKAGGNWEESRMARLGGDFAGIVKASVPAVKADALMKALRAETRGDTHVFVRISDAGDAPATMRPAAFVLTLAGADHEGIAYNISRFLASKQVNVISMETGITHAPVSGTPLFHMNARIILPHGLTVDEVRDGLDQTCHDQGVEIEIKPDA